jgi:hypothetical protein
MCDDVMWCGVVCGVVWCGVQYISTLEFSRDMQVQPTDDEAAVDVQSDLHTLRYNETVSSSSCD